MLDELIHEPRIAYFSMEIALRSEIPTLYVRIYTKDRHSGHVRIPTGYKNLIKLLAQQKTLGKSLVICEVNSHLHGANRLLKHHTTRNKTMTEI